MHVLPHRVSQSLGLARGPGADVLYNNYMLCLDFNDLSNVYFQSDFRKMYKTLQENPDFDGFTFTQGLVT